MLTKSHFWFKLCGLKNKFITLAWVLWPIMVLRLSDAKQRSKSDRETQISLFWKFVAELYLVANEKGFWFQDYGPKTKFSALAWVLWPSSMFRLSDAKPCSKFVKVIEISLFWKFVAKLYLVANEKLFWFEDYCPKTKFSALAWVLWKTLVVRLTDAKKWSRSAKWAQISLFWKFGARWYTHPPWVGIHEMAPGTTSLNTGGDKFEVWDLA